VLAWKGWHHCDIHLALAHPLPFRDSVRQTSYEHFSLSVSRKAGAQSAICMGIGMGEVPHSQDSISRGCHLAKEEGFATLPSTHGVSPIWPDGMRGS
jgi:hypothetical protein